MSVAVENAGQVGLFRGCTAVLGELLGWMGFDRKIAATPHVIDRFPDFPTITPSAVSVEAWLRPETIATENQQDAVDVGLESLSVIHTDPITGLTNRLGLLRAMREAVTEARESGTAVTLIHFRIDYFAQLAARCAAAEREAVIRQVVELARRCSREGDRIARTGVAEFHWLLPATHAFGAQAAAERLRWTVAAGTLAAPFPAVTISAGIATLGSADTSSELLERAGLNLAKAANSGGNCVIWQELPAPSSGRIS